MKKAGNFQNGAAGPPQFVICQSVNVGFASASWWVRWHTHPNPRTREYATLHEEGALNV